MAKAAMTCKRQLLKPTPARVRARCPRLCVNPDTAVPASSGTILTVFRELCYDEDEDDPWVYMSSPCKDYLSDGMVQSRLVFAEHFLRNFPAGGVVGSRCHRPLHLDPPHHTRADR